MRLRAPATILLCALLWSPAAALAQDSSDEDAPPSLLLILDASGSMNGAAGGGQTKIAAAKEALRNVVNELPDEALVGLRVYGHRIPNTNKREGCKDTELISPVHELDRGAMRRRIAAFQAKGFTPIGLSLREAAKDLPDEGPRTIVLVSDGIDTCAPPPPCKVARQISAQGVDLRIDTVGFQVDPQARKQLQCIARAGGGTYEDARSAAELVESVELQSLRGFRRYRAAGDAIAGGDALESAPTVIPGRYVDTIADGETRYYAFDLELGQQLSASATLVGRPRADGGGRFSIDLLDTEGAENLAGDSALFEANQSQTLSATTPVVGDHFIFDEPGRHWVAVEVSSGNGIGSKRLELELIFDVTGGASPSPSPPPDEPQPDAGEGDGDIAAPPDPGDGGVSDFPLSGSLASLVLGFLAGALLTLALRRHR